MLAVRAAEAPDCVAVRDIARGADLTREGLEAASDLLAARLAAEGLGPGDLVCHFGSPGSPRIAAFTGAFKAGCAFAALEPGQPDAALVGILEATGARLVLVDDAAGTARMSRLAPVFLLPAPESVDRQTTAVFTPTPMADDAPAVVRFTSGSSGLPKVISQNVEIMERLLKMYPWHYCLGPQDRTCMTGSWWAGLYFTALTKGATLVMADFAALGPQGLAEALRGEGVTHLSTFTAAFRALVAAGPAPFPALREIGLSGEALSAQDARAFDRITAPGAIIRNGYSSNEVPLITSWIHTHGDPIAWEWMPLGRPDAPDTVRVLDAAGADAAEGEVGEIVVEGRHFAHGWIGRPKETAAAFRDSPDRPGDRQWFSGDLGWFDGAGVLHGAGRRDDQVKILGYNVRLMEVERSLAALPGVAEAAAMVSGGPGGVRRLAAHVVPEPGVTLIPSDLRRALGAAHPRWMVPGRIRIADALPRTKGTRKVLRRALPDPFQEPGHAVGEGGPPCGPTEKAVARVWREMLGDDEFGREDDFFDVGGDSLQAMTMALHCEAVLGVRLLFESLVLDGATIAGIARRLDAARAAGRSLAGGRLVPLNRPAAPERPLLYAMHVATGDLSDLLALSDAMAGRASVIGVRPVSDQDARSRMRDYGVDAAEAIDADLRASPGGAPRGGPVLLGFSFGALVALEAAQALVAQGRDAPRLILLDPPIPWMRRAPVLSRLRATVQRSGAIAALKEAGRMLGAPKLGGRRAAAGAALTLAAPSKAAQSTPSLLLLAGDARSVERRETAMRALLGPSMEVLRAPGLHMDLVSVETAPRLAARITDWLERTSTA